MSTRLFLPATTWGFGLLLSCLAPGARAQQLSVAQARQAALAQSYLIKNRGLSLEAARQGQRAARWAYFPKVSAVGVGVYGFKDLVPPIPDVLPKGVNNLYLANLSASETIYAGGRIGLNNQLAGLQTAVREVSYAEVRDSIVLLTDQKYWQVVQAQQQLRTLQASARYLDQLLKELADNLRAGLIARNDLLKVRVQRSEVRLNQSKAANARQLALFDLALFIGQPADSLPVLTDTAAAVFDPARLYVPPAQAAQGSRTRQLLEKSVEASRLQTRLKQAEYRPSVSVGVGAATFGVVNRGIGSSTTPTATATVNLPISDLWGEARATVKQRRIAEVQAENQLADGLRQVQVGVASAWNDLTEAYERVGLATESLAQAAENLQVNRANYRAGLNPLSDLLDAQRLHQQAASQLVSARAEFQLRLSMYQYLTTPAAK